MIIYQPYTYLIGWSNHNKWYYGVRYARNCNPQDLWNTYFTSSKYVKKFRKQYGEPDIIQVRKIFDSKQSAILWEEKVLQKLKVRNNEKWLNKNDCSAPPLMIGEEHPLFDIGHTEESKQKMRKSRGLGVPKSEEHKKKISEAKKKNWATNYGLREKFSKKMKGNDYGKRHKGWKPSVDTKQKMSEAKFGRNQRRCSCLLCHTEISISNIKQHYRHNHKEKEGK